MACPFFSPTERAENIALSHPARLPLGAAWRGRCKAPGSGLLQLGEAELEACNLGYAHACPRLPEERIADAVRFGVARRSAEKLVIHFVLERSHLPAGHGTLEYDRTLNQWICPQFDSRIQHLAECFLQSYLERHPPDRSLS